MVLGNLEVSQAVHRSQSHGEMGGALDSHHEVLAERFQTIEEEDELKAFLTNNGEVPRKLTEN